MDWKLIIRALLATLLLYLGRLRRPKKISIKLTLDATECIKGMHASLAEVDRARRSLAPPAQPVETLLKTIRGTSRPLGGKPWTSRDELYDRKNS